MPAEFCPAAPGPQPPSIRSPSSRRSCPARSATFALAWCTCGIARSRSSLSRWYVTLYHHSLSVTHIDTLTTQAEDRNSPNPTLRLVSESFFTLVRCAIPPTSSLTPPDTLTTQVAIDPVSGRPLKGQLRQVQVPDGPAREIADGAAKRREDRLQDKRILQRCVFASGPIRCPSRSLRRSLPFLAESTPKPLDYIVQCSVFESVPQQQQY